jgi:hypothetical protein
MLEFIVLPLLVSRRLPPIRYSNVMPKRGQL